MLATADCICSTFGNWRLLFSLELRGRRTSKPTLLSLTSLSKKSALLIWNWFGSKARCLELYELVAKWNLSGRNNRISTSLWNSDSESRWVESLWLFPEKKKLNLLLPLTLICVNILTVYKDMLVVKGLKNVEWIWKFIDAFNVQIKIMEGQKSHSDTPWIETTAWWWLVYKW